MGKKLNVRQTLLKLAIGDEVKIPASAARLSTLRHTASLLRDDFSSVLHINKASGYYRVWREA